MLTPIDRFREVLAASGDPLLAIRSVRKEFGLSLPESKEVWLQATGVASSLDEHQGRIARVIEQMCDDEQ
jgi:hypothetical protein